VAHRLLAGRAVRDAARRTGKYYSAASILAELDRRLQRQRGKASRPKA
jgi:hypothetical protein